MKKTTQFSMNMIKKYRWNSLFFKYLYKIVLIILIPILIIVALVSYYVVSSETRKAREVFSDTHNKTLLILNNICSLNDRLAYELLYDNNIIFYANNKDDSISAMHQSQRMSEISSRFVSARVTNSYVRQIHFFSFINDYVISTGGSNYIPSFFDKACYDYYKETGESNFVLPTSYTIGRQKNHNISFCYGIYSENSVIGLLVINIYQDEFHNAIRSHNYDTYVVDDNRNMIYASDGSRKLDKGLWRYISKEPIDFVSGSQMIRSSPVENTDLFYIATYKSFQNSYNISFFIFILVFVVIVVFAVSLALSFYFSMNFYHSIAQIASKLENVYQDELTSSGFDELDFISKQIMAVTDKNKNIELELIEKISKLKKAQTIALQTQINPHFLFNTLAVINTIIMGMENKPNNAERLVKLTSDLLRYALATSEYIVSVSEELDSAKKYIEIETIKYKNSFDVNWQISLDVLECKMVKYVLQPIIENAFKHGLRPLQERRGLLSISAKKSDDLLIFKIKNDGEPIPKETLENIKRNMQENDLPENKHIGLANVNQRIKLIYGEKYGCYIKSDEKETTVTILLPVVKE